MNEKPGVFGTFRPLVDLIAFIALAWGALAAAFSGWGTAALAGLAAYAWLGASAGMIAEDRATARGIHPVARLIVVPIVGLLWPVFLAIGLARARTGAGA